jgi:methylated-DNA-[protein]-cysteine S-methyltransferase
MGAHELSMKKLFGILDLPILVSVRAQEQIQHVTLKEHPEGLAFEINNEASKKLVKEILRFFESYVVGKNVPLLSFEWGQITPFTRSVLHQLAGVSFGKTETYAQIAKKVGSPQGARAVGGACGRNPFPFFIPCHRIVGTQGLGGFSAGLIFKENLINFEKLIRT